MSDQPPHAMITGFSGVFGGSGGADGADGADDANGGDGAGNRRLVPLSSPVSASLSASAPRHGAAAGFLRLAAALVLSVGLGAAALLLVFAAALRGERLPWRDPGRLVMVGGTFTDHGQPQPWPASQMDFADWRRRGTFFSGMSVYGSLGFNLERGPESRRLWGELVDDSYFPALGLHPAAGRFFNPDEDRVPFARYVVVLGHDLWRRGFGGDPAVVGRTVRLNSAAYQVVGVAPPGFRGLSDQAELWVPSMVPPIPDYLQVRRERWLAGVGRLRPAVTAGQAQRQLDGITADLARRFPDMNRGMGAAVTPLGEALLGKARASLRPLAVAVAAGLLLAWLDFTLLLAAARGGGRRQGVAAPGKSASAPGTSARGWRTGSLVLALTAGGAGLIVAWLAGPLLAAAHGAGLPSFVHATPTPGVAAVVLGLAALGGLAAGGLAGRGVAGGAGGDFRDGGDGRDGRDDGGDGGDGRDGGDDREGRAGGAPPGRGWRRLAAVAVAVQVLAAVGLLVVLGLRVRAYRQVSAEDLGFQAGDLLTFRIDLKGPQYASNDLVTGLLRERFLPRLAAVPGVDLVAMADPTVPSDGLVGGYMTVEDHDNPASPDGTYISIWHSVSPGYFAALGIPILRGRAFDGRDVTGNPVIVSKAMADQQWPGRDPLGRRIKIDVRNSNAEPWLTVVGVAAEVRNEGHDPEREPAPDLYLSLLQHPLRLPLTINFLVRPRPGTHPATLRQALRRAMVTVAPELPPYDMAALQERLDAQTARERLEVIVHGILALVALVLAAAALGAWAAWRAGASGPPPRRATPGGPVAGTLEEAAAP